MFPSIKEVAKSHWVLEHLSLLPVCILLQILYVSLQTHFAVLCAHYVVDTFAPNYND